jgi:signal transduction histidine kinase
MALFSAVVVIACTVVTGVLVPPDERMPLVWAGAAAAVAVALTVAVTARWALTRHSRHYIQHQALLTRRLGEQEAAMVRLARELLPDAVSRVQQGESAQDVLSKFPCEIGLTPQFQDARKSVVHAVVEAVQAEEDLREAAERAMVSIARRVQAIVHQQSQDLRDMEDRHGTNPKVFSDLLHLDHGNALIGRLADSVVFLGGGRPGQQWPRPISLLSVLRGAMSRILDYRRVELASVPEGIAVIGPMVAPVIHALAELLDNATRYSPPHAKVIMSAIEVQNGLAVEIEDLGLGLSEEARECAEQTLRRAQAGMALTDLGETPRLGLAVVGRLCRTYDFGVELRPSGYGGVRAVLNVPKDLITTLPASGQAHGIGALAGSRVARARSSASPSIPAARTGAASPGLVPENGDVPEVTEWTDRGLPRRQRRRSVPSAPRPTAASGTESHSVPAKPVEPGMWLADFHRGLSGEIPAATRQEDDAASDKGE